MADKAVHSFKIIKHAGVPTKAQLPNGKWVYRSDKIYVPEWGEFVQVAPYDNHFLYESKVPKAPSYMCTCGSMAVITGYNAYKKDASPSDTGKLFLCHAHALNGKHSDGTN